MINKTEHPIGWSLLVQELQDAHEHLGQLLEDLCNNKDYGEEELAVDLGHVYGHLNRSWVRRNVEDDLTDQEWDSSREYPNDLRPIA